MKSLPLGATLCVTLSLVLTLLSQWGLAPVQADRFIDWGAKNTVAMVESGEWWRLITASFLHTGTLHWLLNAALILGFGGAIETLYKRSDAFLVYASAGLATTIASTLNSDGIALGSSGIALGCLTCTITFALLYYNEMQPRERFLLLAATLPTASTYLAGGFIAPNVDNAGHIAGACAGLLCGLALDPRRPKPVSFAWVPLGIIIAVSAASALLPWSSLDWRSMRPADDLRVDLPSTFFDTGPQSFENTLGSSILLEVSEPKSADIALADYQESVLARFAEAEDIRHLRLQPVEHTRIGGLEALVLPLSFDGPRGQMVGWHVWVSSRHTAVHAVWTARAKRQSQNEALFRTWLQHFYFSP